MNNDFGVKIAEHKDIILVSNLYDKVNIYLSKNINYTFPHWKIGEYPNYDIAKNAFDNDSLYIIKSDFFSDEEEVDAAVILDEKQLDGYEIFKWNCEAFKKEVLVLHTIVTNPEKRNKGFAKDLIDFSKNYAKKSSAKTIRLTTHKTNTPARNLYKKCGFIEVFPIDNAKLDSNSVFSAYDFVL